MGHQPKQQAMGLRIDGGYVKVAGLQEERLTLDGFLSLHCRYCCSTRRSPQPPLPSLTAT